MPWSYPTSTPEVSHAPAGCLAPGNPGVYSCLRQRRLSPDPSAALVIPTRIKSASTTATWISSGSTLPNGQCPMECRATPDLSESDVMLVDKQLNVRGRRLSAAFVLCLIQTLSAMLFVCQASCRQCQSGVSTESLVLDDRLTHLRVLFFSSGAWTLPSSSAPSLSVWHSCLHRYAHIQGERALEFDTADIPQHRNSWSKFHQAEWFQELFSKFDTDPWRLSPFYSPLIAA